MRQILSIVIFMLMCSCQPKQAKDPARAPTEIGETSEQEITTSAQNSLDYLGLYKGKFQCPDCKNSEVLLELSEDFSYVFSKYANGKTETKTERKGTFKWDVDGKGILLSNLGETYDHYLVGDHSLIALDENGEKIFDFTLKKLPEAEAQKTDESPDDKKAPKLTGIHWKLSEINDKPISNAGENDFFIELKTDNTFLAFAGCNRMSGKYQITGSKVKMSQIISTRMACPEMEIENQMKAALELSDNFVANQEILQFRKGGTNLIKFEAVAK